MSQYKVVGSYENHNGEMFTRQFLPAQKAGADRVIGYSLDEACEKAGELLSDHWFRVEISEIFLGKDHDR